MAVDYARRLLAAFLPAEVKPAAQSKLIEPLSERELEVLHYLAAGLTNQEIADRLYLSLNTIKVHTRNIYGKLGVNHRTQAVARAQELGILPRS
jgi:LuxR family maltose regulon positive regulatory protein